MQEGNGDKMDQNIKARVQTNKKLYIHNDLSQGATYFNDTIQDKLRKGSRDAIAFGGMACALMIAFAFEANLNFMGSHLLTTGKVTSWDERSKFAKKLKKVFEAIGIPVEIDKRPLYSMQRMKDLRDTLAHGKPVEIENEEEKIGTREELRKGLSLAANWEQEVRPEVVSDALEDLDKLWKLMIEKSGIDVTDTISQAEGSITFIERVKKP
jgi:hypothetical protein